MRVYHENGGLALSDVLPILENLGFRVLEQVAYTVRPAGARLGIDVFKVQNASGRAIDVRADGPRLIEATEAILRGEAEHDRLGRLVLYGGLTVREVALLRTYQMYFAQLNAVVSRRFVNEALLAHPEVARALVARFAARFDPSLKGDRAAAEAAADEAFVDSLGEVASLPEDQVLRGLADLIRASVRCDYYQGNPWIAFKLDSAKVGTMPDPRPMFEIGVAGPNVEGTHLRGGRVARGGLRWSDRPDDFRTEVLGLMKTQMTKNAVIVPVGSKGGFVLKRAPSDREALRAFVEEQYRTFIRALLGLTDNVVGDAVEHPAGLVIHDGADPYLVVAADKGTATFSDVANGVAAEMGFWLGDAFASGGSAGYDHKREGITARGAWAAVHRHFREIGLDPRADAFTAVGIGDMSGDVFGNGFLHTETVQLVAAFNHLHVFLDPEPDPKAAFQERQRLFRLAAQLVGRLRRVQDLGRRRGLRPGRQAHRALAAGARPARHRRRGALGAGPGARDPQGTGRPALERRHRHLRQGDRRAPRRRRGRQQRRGAHRRAGAARAHRRRGGQPGAHPVGAHRVRARRRAHPHRRDRQLRRRRPVGPRGQPQAGAAPAGRHRRALAGPARPGAARGRPTRCAPWCCATTPARRWRWRSGGAGAGATWPCSTP